MHQLSVSKDWAMQISAIRDAHTDSTSILRPKLDTYRICRNTAESFGISIYPSIPPESLPLVLLADESSLYIRQIGTSAMERYSSMLTTDERTKQSFQVSRWRIDSAILDLLRNTNKSARFENQTLLTFCIAESLRSDALAQNIASVIDSGGSMDIQSWVVFAKNWEYVSRQILKAQIVSSDLKDYALSLKTLCRSQDEA